MKIVFQMHWNLEDREIESLSIDNMVKKVQEEKDGEEKVIEVPHIDFIFGDRLSL